MNASDVGVYLLGSLSHSRHTKHATELCFHSSHAMRSTTGSFDSLLEYGYIGNGTKLNDAEIAEMKSAKKFENHTTNFDGQHVKRVLGGEQSMEVATSADIVQDE